jgi:hypothetical protein
MIGDVAKAVSQFTEKGFEILKCDLYSNSGGERFDLLGANVLQELTIHETMFDSKMYGEIGIVDSLNLAETVPIVGNERVEIVYRTSGDMFLPIRISGIITNVLGKARGSGQGFEISKLEFISEVNFLNRFLYVDQSLNGTITNMATSLFQQYFKKDKDRFFTNTTTKETHRFIIPRWTPLFTLSWLASRAFTDKSESFFVFYEDIDGHHFKDLLTDIKNKNTKYTYRVEPKNAYNLGDPLGFLTRVLSYAFTSHFDRLDEFNKGMYSGTVLAHDITTKKLNRYEYDYFDSFNDPSRSKLNQHPIFPQSKTSELYVDIGKERIRHLLPMQTMKTNQILDNDQYDKFYLSKKSINRQFMGNQVSMKVPGNSSLRLTDIIGFEIPKVGYKMNEDVEYLDPHLSGNYMITSLRHVLNIMKGYETHIDMSKESVIQPMPAVIV